MPGEFDVTPIGGGDNETTVPTIGWDFVHTSTTGTLNRYIIDEELQGGDVISITLAWDRHVEFEIDGGTPDFFDSGDTFEEYTDPNTADDVINDLSLFLVETATQTPTMHSIAPVGTVEHIFGSVPFTGDWEIWVYQEDNDIAGGQDYGLAWWYGLAPEIEAPVGGDFDGDGDVDHDDLSQWEGDYGINGDSDADGDGDSDGADFLVWQQNFGFGTLSEVSAVPEPATWLLLASCSLVVPMRKRVARSDS